MPCVTCDRVKVCRIIGCFLERQDVVNASFRLKKQIKDATTVKKARIVLEKINGKIKSYELQRRQRIRETKRNKAALTKIERVIYKAPAYNKKFEDFLKERQCNFHYEDLDKSGKPIIIINHP